MKELVIENGVVYEITTTKSEFNLNGLEQSIESLQKEVDNMNLVIDSLKKTKSDYEQKIKEVKAKK